MTPRHPTRAGHAEPAEASPRRRVRVFVALHLGAVLTIYGLALSVGGGLAAPPLPAEVMAARAPAVAHAAAPLPSGPENAANPAAVPAWTQRAELAAPWHEPPAGSR